MIRVAWMLLLVAALAIRADAQAYARLKSGSRNVARSRDASSQARSRNQLEAGWGGTASWGAVSPSGDLAAPARLSTRPQTWSPSDGDPYTVAVERFQAAEKMSPFTYLENQPKKCGPEFTVASSDSNPELRSGLASCFDACAVSTECA